MQNSDQLASLLYLKNNVHKWKNIALLLGIFSLIIVIKLVFGTGVTNNVIDSDYIANIKIEGIIFEDDYRSEVLLKLAKDKAVKAVLIEVNSPGGGIVGSEILFNDLRTIIANKPIVVLMESVAASGAYMASVASDYIIAYNGTLTGSIGVLMESPEVTDLASKIGIKLHTYKSAPLKGSPSPFEKPNPAVDRVIQESIADSYKFFTDLVRDRRGSKLNPNFIREAFDGRVFTGRQALAIGLIDEVGGKDEALSYLAAQKIDTKKLPLRTIEIIQHENKFLDHIFGMIPFFDGTKTKNSNHKIMAVME